MTSWCLLSNLCMMIPDGWRLSLSFPRVFSPLLYLGDTKRLKFYDEVLLLDFVNYSNMFFIQSSYTQERIHRSSDGTHWIYGRFFLRIRILQSVKGKWKSNRPRSIVLFILGEKRVSGTPPLNTILPGQQCPHHGIWDGIVCSLIAFGSKNLSVIKRCM